MRLNGLGAPEESTLVPLKTLEAVPWEKREQNQKRYKTHNTETVGI